MKSFITLGPGIYRRSNIHENEPVHKIKVLIAYV